MAKKKSPTARVAPQKVEGQPAQAPSQTPQKDASGGQPSSTQTPPTPPKS